MTVAIKILIVIIFWQYLLLTDAAPAEGGITPEQVQPKTGRLEGMPENSTNFGDPEKEFVSVDVGGGDTGSEAGGDTSKLNCRKCDSPCKEESVCVNATICFKYRLIDAYGKEYLVRGCFPEKDHSSNLQCSTNEKGPSSKVFWVYECCSSGDFCNDGPFPEDDEPPTEITPPPDTDANITLYIVLGISGAVILLVFIATVIIWKRNGGEESMKSLDLLKNLEITFSSSGGNGPKLLVQRTLANSIELMESIGQGRFGNVRKGLWRDEFVAVKIFNVRDEASWKWETEIYKTVLARHHENILTFYTSRDTCSCPAEYWLVTQYHSNGSLFDYLNKRTLSESSLLKLAFSFASGLAFLHTELARTGGSSGIAHRDIKSKNILVSEQETCVIADFGLAVTHNFDTNELNIDGANPKVGTVRYMAPEILSDSIKRNSFDVFKRVDMHAVGLVLWEMCRRTETQGVAADDYQVPFYDKVNSDPKFDEMKEVVCTLGYRPSIPDRWSSSHVLQRFSRLMKECWYPNPSARLTALRVKKSIDNVAAEAKEMNREVLSDFNVVC